MENLDAERDRRVEGQSLANRSEANGQIKESVDASFLADELLQYAIIPASQEELEVLRAFAINPVRYAYGQAHG